MPNEKKYTDEDGNEWTAEQLTKLKKSSGGLRSQLNRKLSIATKLADQAINQGRSQALYEKLEKAIDGVNEQADKLLEARRKILVVDDEDEEDENQEALDEVNKTLEHSDRLFAAALAAAAGPDPAVPAVVIPAAGAGGPPRRMFKANESTKPVDLTTTTKFPAFKDWKDRFRFYYSTSNMDTLRLLDQLGYLRSCIHETLWTRVEEKMAGLPIFGAPGDASCMAVLDEEFRSLQPVFVRQFEFFRTRQEKNQTFSDYLAKLESLSRDAELNTLSPDQIQVFVALSGAQPGKLRTKLAELDKPSLEDIKRVAQQWEIAAQAEKEMKRDEAAHVAVATGGRGGPARRHGRGDAQGGQGRDTHGGRGGGRDAHGGRGGGRMQDEPPFTHERLKQERRCFCCGEQGHTRNECPDGAGAFCNRCKRYGHISQACCSAARESATEPSSRASSRASSPVSSRESSPERVDYVMAMTGSYEDRESRIKHEDDDDIVPGGRVGEETGKKSDRRKPVRKKSRK